MKTIRFKSIPKYFRKEFLGLKNNTIRELNPNDIDDEIRIEMLHDFMDKKLTDLTIIISNTKTMEQFERQVCDVSRYNDMYIITWVQKLGGRTR